MGGAVDESNNVAPNQKTERMDEVVLPEMVKYFKRITVSQWFVSLPAPN